MKIRRLLLGLLLSLPFTIYAYPSSVYLGGDNIGIEMKTKGVLVIGLYKVNGDLIGVSSNLDKGDYITSIDNKEINDIDEFSSIVNDKCNNGVVDIKYNRNNKEYSSKLRIEKEDDECKTGLYVKDEVTGIGTLTLIDPETNKFFALGHAVLDSNSNTILNINSGSIYSSKITGINRSSNGNPGEKIGEADSSNVYGIINKNTERGIFGKYEKDFSNKKLIKVADDDEITTGEATISTVLDEDNIKEYKINIDKVDKNDKLKNIMFTITDKELLEKTGGIVQGMSGSPIVQNNKIVGAVTHVVVDNPTRGYGIFITNMYDES